MQRERISRWRAPAGGLTLYLWLLVLAACVVARLLLGRSDRSYLVIVAPYLLVSIATPVLIVIGTLRHRPPHRGGWLILAVAQLLYATGDTMSVFDNWLGEFLEPTPADVVYFIYYAFAVTAVLMFIRRRTPGWDLASGIDALIVACSAGLLTWVYLVEPLTSDSGLPLAAKLTESAYPVLDLMLLILAVRLMLGAGTRGPVLYLLLTSLTLMFTADLLYAVLGVVSGESTTEAWLDAVWMTSLGLLAAAALHSGIRTFDQRTGSAIPDASRGRLLMLAIAVLMAPAVQMIEHLRGDDLSVPLASAACAVMFLLVLARMSGLVATQRQVAVNDGLTGLRTRRAFEESLTAECRRAKRHGYEVGLLIVDVDHFKRVNDTYGHPAGDRTLREVADRLRNNARTGSVVGRYGGEEFVLLAPHIDAVNLRDFAERIRVAVAGLPVKADDDVLLGVTVSVGGATGTDPGDLMRVADAALYEAKAAGRNRSVLAAAD
ncbi:diguanylate cyclase (GGDEF)-like protein [Actinoplanes lutulentus]|uniref:Diguanylate cyclase (GGDEF)-like protein n=1 Tax=Actinoplanes lutulentus TaxID=1287878 RepID=A0A327ZH49_9ACTN|nr:GGDEF domain-containing protein [Actinoplanes lutulentus]MBB2941393.1 diguanylate cyclase (GGDEF)-like protein [Actinoplanes lutulentus]RAK36884.1 diguanylate cyclase (GGDEF)-like protein [Actinoplanes lutulentus]